MMPRVLIDKQQIRRSRIRERCQVIFQNFPKEGHVSKKLIVVLLSRCGVIIMSILLALLMFQGCWDVVEDFAHIDRLQHDMEEVLAGLAAILVAFGVATEERGTLLGFIGLYPDGQTPQQQRENHYCHGYGVSLLLLGLFVEVAVYLIRMPDLNTVDFDPALIVLSMLLSLWGGAVLLRLGWLLWRDA